MLTETIEDHTANSYVIASLEEYALYEITMQAYNDVGSSSPSPRALERTRESGITTKCCKQNNNTNDF